MAGKTLYDKLWESHVVREESDGTCLLYIDRHLMHEVTSPQAFEGLRLAGRKPWRTSSIVATADHNTPTTGWEQGYEGIADPTSRQQVQTLDANIRPEATGVQVDVTVRAPTLLGWLGVPQREAADFLKALDATVVNR